MQQTGNKKWMWQLPFLVLLIVGTVLIIRHERNVPYQKSADKVFGTFYHATYQCDSDLTYSINAELAKVDASLSPFNKNSIITAVNQNEDVEVNDMFQDVFYLAMQISKETDGAFDITVAPLVNAWGFGFKNGIEPTKEQVDSLMQIIGYQKVSLSGGKITKTDDRVMLDCSAIAKGYGTDVVARLLRSKGVKNFMVEIPSVTRERSSASPQAERSISFTSLSSPYSLPVSDVLFILRKCRSNTLPFSTNTRTPAFSSRMKAIKSLSFSSFVKSFT